MTPATWGNLRLIQLVTQLELKLCYDLLSFGSMLKVFPSVLMIGSSPLRWLFFYLIVSRYQTDFTSPWKLTWADWGESSTPRSQSPWLVTTTPGRAGSSLPTRLSADGQLFRYRITGSMETGSCHVSYLARPYYFYDVPSRYGYSK